MLFQLLVLRRQLLRMLHLPMVLLALHVLCCGEVPFIARRQLILPISRWRWNGSAQHHGHGPSHKRLGSLH